MIRLGRHCFIALLLAGAPARAQREPAPPPVPSPRAEVAPRRAQAPKSLPHVLHASVGQGFELESADGRQSLRIGTLLSARAGVNTQGGRSADPTAGIRLARIATLGRLSGDSLTYFFQGEFAGAAPSLLDAALEWHPIDELGLRFGRIRVPLGRQWITSTAAQMLPDRSVVTGYFRPGRDTGVTLEANVLGRRLEMRVGAYGERDGPLPLVGARLAVAPLGPLPYAEDISRGDGPLRFAIGLNGYYSNASPPPKQVVDLTTGDILSEPQPLVQRLVTGADLALRVGGLGVFAEAYVDRRRGDAQPDTKSFGAFAQTGYFIVPNGLELSVRCELLTPDLEGGGSDGLRRYEVGLSEYFVDGSLKVQERYAHTRIVGAPGALTRWEGDVADVQFVLAL